MHVICPHCQNPMDLAETAVQDEILCPVCGTTFRLERGSTTGWRPGEGGRKLGRFEVIGTVGSGAFGTVYMARDPELDRVVAVKVPRAGQLSGGDELQRFLREARSVAQLHHPSIVPVHEVGQQEGLPYLVTEFVRGLTLADVLTARRPSFRESAGLIAAVADALQYAHEQGVVHRDVKPSNIMLDEHGAPRLMDFGLAKREAGEVTMTIEGQVLGTPAYMSPEQARGDAHKVDGRSDVYSLGVVLYQLLTGELPFRGNQRMLLHQVLHDDPRSPHSLNDGIPRDLETICLKAMAKEPGRRYATARELADDLRRWLKGEPIQARPVGAWERGWRWVKRRPDVAGLLAVGFVAALALVGVMVGAAYNAQLQTALDEAQRARDAEKEQRKKAEQFQYFHHIARAHAGLRDGNVAEAERLLGACPQEQRRWEWHYLKRLCHAEVLTLAGHTDWVRAIAFSPDGRRLASAGADKTVKIWDVTTGRLRCTLTGHTKVVCGVTFSPDGKLLASASEEEEVIIWDVLAERKLHSFPIKLRAFSNLAYSPDRARLAAVSEEQDTVKVWDATTGQEILTVPNSSGARAVAFSPDGKKLAWARAFDRSAKVWGFEAGQVLFTITGHRDMIGGLAFSPDGKRLATASFDRTVKVWDMTSDRRGEVVSPLLTLIGHTSVVYGVAFSPDGAQIASASFDRSVRVWDAVTGQEKLTLTGHTDGINGLAFSPDGTRLASAGRDKTVKVWDPTTRQDDFTFKGQTETWRLWAVTFSADGTRLASAGTDDGAVKVWDAATRQEIRTLSGHTHSVGGVAFSPDGTRLASASEDKTVRIWDTVTGQPIHILKGHKKAVIGVAFSSDGIRLASASPDNTIKIWDAAKGQLIRTLPGHDGGVVCVAFSPDGKLLASGGWDEAVRIWDAATGRPIRTFKGHTSVVRRVTFSPDGSRLASAGLWDKTVKIWEVKNEHEPRTLVGHTDYVGGIAFSRDGIRLASASPDQTVRIWDVTTGQEVLTLRSPTSGLYSLAFSPDGTRLAAGGVGPTPVIWDGRPWTPDAALEREALGLLDHLFSKPLCKADVAGYLQNSPTIRPRAGRLALSLMGRYREATDPRRYHDAAWPVLRHPYANPFQVPFALQQAQTACRLAPKEAKYRTALGAALYRAGKYEQARETLKKAEQGHKAMPANLAFLAMAQHRPGKEGEAKATLARLREVMKHARWAKDEEAHDLLREAEAVVAAKARPEK